MNPWRSMDNKPLKWVLLLIAAVAPLPTVIAWRRFAPNFPWNNGQVAPIPQDQRAMPDLIADSNDLLESTELELTKQTQFMQVYQRMKQLISAGDLDEATKFLNQRIAELPDNELLPKLYEWLESAEEK